MLNEKTFYVTQNINLATTLLTLNFPISGFFPHDNSEIVDFYFEDSPEIRRIIDDFWNRRLQVEPQTLLINRKEILDTVKNVKSSEKWSTPTPENNIQGERKTI